MKKKKVIITIVVIIVLALALMLARGCKGPITNLQIDSAVVSRASVTNTVTATGTIQAVKTVDVGTQVSGVISKLYVDYNSKVKKGDIMAELDKTPLLATLNNAQASLDDAKAELTYRTSTYNRVKTLFDKQLVAQSDFDEALYAYNKAVAATKMAQSNFDKAQINLNYATIYSPIDGVILSRKVSEGQTVAANFSTPTLFSIANDLTQMQVEANIDEADIGMVKKGQTVNFAVDAFPDRNFTGFVSEIRLQSVTTSNVVTYTVIITAANPDQKLMPGMTANIEITVESAENVLVVPNKALQVHIDTAALASYLGMMQHTPHPAMPQMPVISSKDKMVWIKKGIDIKPITVVTGVASDIETEVKSGLHEGDVVLTDLSISSQPNGAQASSPFMPKPPKK